ncbi:MAG TPA: hypothetical protein VFC19_42005 [Candidatus Limnocylindrales bacterium]|nr:hypothetical protein [Candidatus Limnocylindrales bacterium]
MRNGSPAPDAISLLWSSGHVDRFDLGALSAETAGALGSAMLGGPLHAAAAARLAELSQGLPLMLQELVLAGREQGVLRNIGGQWRWDGGVPLNQTLKDLITLRLAGVNTVQLEALELVALAEPIGLRLVEELTSPEAIETLEAHGLIRLERDGLRSLMRLGHPLHGEVVRGTIPASRAQRHYRRLAESVESYGARRRDDLVRMCIWRIDSGTATDPERLLSACWMADAACNFPLAERLARAARATGGGARALWMLVGTLNEAERWTKVEHLTRDLAFDDPQAVRIALSRTFALRALNRSAEADTLFDRLTETVIDPELSNQVRLARAAADLDQGHPLSAVTATESLLRRTDLTVGQRAAALVGRAAALAVSGRTSAAKHHVAEALELHSQWRDQWASLMRTVGWALVLASEYAGDIAGIDHAVDLATAEIGMFTGPGLHQHVPRLKSVAMHMRGRPRSAIACLRDAESLTDRSPLRAYFGALLAHNLALTQQIEAAQAQFVEARHAQALPGAMLSMPYLQLAAVWISAQAGRLSEARDQTIAAAEHAAHRGLTGIEMTALHTLVRIGFPHLAAPRLRQIAGEHDGNLAPIMASHADAYQTGNGTGLTEVARRFTELGMLLHAAEAWAQATSVHHATGNTGSAIVTGHLV